MKTLINTQSMFKLFVLIGLLVISAGNVMAQQKTKKSTALPDSVKIAVINLNVIRRNAKVVVDISKQISVYAKSYQEEVQKEDKALKAANAKLLQKRTILAREAFVAERKKFEQKVVAMQRLVQKRKQDLNKARSDAMLVVEEQLSKIIADLAEKQDIGIIVRQNQVILSSKQLDITDTVLAQLDKVLPSHKVAKLGKK